MATTKRTSHAPDNGVAPARAQRKRGFLGVPLWALGYVALLSLGVLYPVVLPSAYFVNLGILTLFFAYQGSAWNILAGSTGLFSFGHAAFFGLGAYTSTLLLVHLGVSPWLGMIVGGVVAGVVGGGFGYLTFRYRVKGHYFALGMFAFAELLRFIFQNLEFVGGSVGILIPLASNDLLLFQFAEKTSYYYVILAMLAVVILITRLLERTRIGYFWASIRSDEVAADSVGVDVVRYKVIAIVLSAAFMAFAGTFYAQFLFFIDPETVFGIDKSLDGLLRGVIGGLGLALGPLFGALFLAPLGEVSRIVLGNRGGADLILYGALLVLAVRFVPLGVLGTIQYHMRKRE